MKDNTKPNTYSIKDLYIATLFLASKQLSLLRLEKINDRSYVFVFDDPYSQAQNIIQAHLSGQYKVISSDLFEALKTLKTRIHLGI